MRFLQFLRSSYSVPEVVSLARDSDSPRQVLDNFRNLYDGEHAKSSLSLQDFTQDIHLSNISSILISLGRHVPLCRHAFEFLWLLAPFGDDAILISAWMQLPPLASTDYSIFICMGILPLSPSNARTYYDLNSGDMNAIKVDSLQLSTESERMIVIGVRCCSDCHCASGYPSMSSFTDLIIHCLPSRTCRAPCKSQVKARA